MQVINDSTHFDGYQQFEDGCFTDSFCASMYINKAKLEVNENYCILRYYDDATKVMAVYNFDKYVEKTDYPAYSFSSFKLYVNGAEIQKNISEAELAAYNEATINELSNVLQFNTIMEKYPSSIQLATINKSLVAHIIMKDGDNLAFMGILFGCE